MLDDPLQRDRDDMVARQLAARGIRSATVLEAMRCVPREKFVPGEYASSAYGDQALPIGFEQTISQPYMVALMTERLELQGAEKVLEIGAGSGYQAAVLSRLARQVISLERIAELAVPAKRILAELGYGNITFVTGDGTLGCPEFGPYDAILVTAAAPHLPQPLYDQLKPAGRLVIPIGNEVIQELECIVRTESGPVVRQLCGCRFVKLIGEAGWPG